MNKLEIENGTWFIHATLTCEILQYHYYSTHVFEPTLSYGLVSVEGDPLDPKHKIYFMKICSEAMTWNDFLHLFRLFLVSTRFFFPNQRFK